jgi:Capsule polysaccharide biosynthesis protein
MPLRELLKRSVRLRLAANWVRARTYAFPDWKPIVTRDRARWDEARTRARGGPRVLIATGVGGHPGPVTLESLLAVALTLRGADVHILLCDRLLPACELTETTWFPDHRRFVRAGPQESLCHICFEPARRAYAPLGLPIHVYGGLVAATEQAEVDELAATLSRAEIERYVRDGIAVGEHAVAGAMRFYARGTLDGEPHADAVLRRYFRAALLTTVAVRRLFAASPFEAVVSQHGIYVPQGLVGETARHAGVRVVNWNEAYRRRRFIFSHGDTYHRTIMAEPTASWERLEWTPRLERDVMAYLDSRRHGQRDWIWFHERPVEDVAEIARRLGVDFSRPCVGMLTNVMWDAQIHYPSNAFRSMLDWTLQTIAYFEKRPELQLLIRVHPAEIRGTLPSRQPIVAEIRQHYPTLPRNVFLIGPEDPISTYATMLECDAVIIYGTKTGVELSSRGVPVIVAGEAWIRGKGVTMDASTPEDYFRLLDQLPLGRRLPEDVVRRARTYAYHFFFRRMIPLEFTRPLKGWLPYRLDLERIEQCAPGRSAGLDVICDGILNGRAFIYPEERGLVAPE